ncbi:MAG: tripartite tricarboxylate transporter substrate binding protein [Betaproteobacteria bacterium]|nr:tripartite tricarboxylate transporter substrate binding protein [Betaproteobacteria bacterium]
MTQVLIRTVTGCVAMAAASLPLAAAAAYRERPVRIVVGFAPGGATDIAARFLAQRLTEVIKGSSFIVENRAGASGTIGAGAVAKSPPDGHMLSVGTSTTHSVAPQLLPNVAYHPVRDFAHITQIATSPMFLVVHPSTPIKSVPELIKLARARPNEINFGAGGIGTTPHMAGELFKLMTHTRMTMVAYKGEAPAIADLIGGQISPIFGNVPAVVQPVRAGSLRGIAVTSAKRVEAVAQFPTIAESGVPGYEASTWFGLFAPAGTPRDIVNQINAASREALQSADAQKKLLALGMYAVASPAEAFQKFVEDEYGKWGKVIKDTGLTVK